MGIPPIRVHLKKKSDNPTLKREAKVFDLN